MKQVGNLKESYLTILKRVIDGLSDRNLERVAKNVGLHANTVRSIANGSNKNPALETLQKLDDYLFGSK